MRAVLTTKGSQCTLSGETGLHLDWGDSHSTTCVCQNSQNYVVHILRFHIHKFNKSQIQGENFFDKVPKQQNSNSQHPSNYLHSVYTVLGITRNQRWFKVRERICIGKHKEPQHPWILFSAGTVFLQIL